MFTRAITPLSLPDPLQDDHRVVPHLVGEIFEAAQPAERGRLLEYLLPPMGVLALVTIANGVFANMRFNGPMADGHVPPDEALKVRSGDVAALVDRLQMISAEAVEGLAPIVLASPAIATTAAASSLVPLLTQRATSRQKRRQMRQPTAAFGQ